MPGRLMSSSVVKWHRPRLTRCRHTSSALGLLWVWLTYLLNDLTKCHTTVMNDDDDDNDDESSINWPPLSSTSHSTVKPHCTWWTTAGQLLSPDSASFSLWTPTPSLSREHTLSSETRVSQLRDREYGTVAACVIATAWHRIQTI